MSMQSSTKERVAAAVALLTIGGIGVIAAGYGDNETTLRARKSVERIAPVVTDGTTGVNRTAARGITRRWTRFAVESLRANVGSTVAAEAANDAGRLADDGETMRTPRAVTVGLPSYEGGRPPSATMPSVQPGTAPSVEPGWTTTVDLGEAPRVSGGSVDHGELGRVNPPTVAVS